MWRKLGITIATVALTACGYSAFGPAELDEFGNPIEVVDAGSDAGLGETPTEDSGN
jgi:hypothetical protein